MGNSEGGRKKRSPVKAGFLLLPAGFRNTAKHLTPPFFHQFGACGGGLPSKRSETRRSRETTQMA
jgi:hypothetical protein